MSALPIVMAPSGPQLCSTLFRQSQGNLEKGRVNLTMFAELPLFAPLPSVWRWQNPALYRPTGLQTPLNSKTPIIDIISPNVFRRKHHSAGKSTHTNRALAKEQPAASKSPSEAVKTCPSRINLVAYHFCNLIMKQPP